MSPCFVLKGSFSSLTSLDLSRNLISSLEAVLGFLEGEAWTRKLRSLGLWGNPMFVVDRGKILNIWIINKHLSGDLTGNLEAIVGEPHVCGGQRKDI
jgi:hypothetical protein